MRANSRARLPKSEAAAASRGWGGGGAGGHGRAGGPENFRPPGRGGLRHYETVDAAPAAGGAAGGFGAEASVDGLAGDVVGGGERPGRWGGGVGDGVGEGGGGGAPNHVNLGGAGRRLDGSGEGAVAVVDEGAVEAHVDIREDDAGDAEVDEVLNKGVEAALGVGAGGGVAIQGGDVERVEAEGVPAGDGLGEDAA